LAFFRLSACKALLRLSLIARKVATQIMVVMNTTNVTSGHTLLAVGLCKRRHAMALDRKKRLKRT
jgi:hypothetical protein